MASAVGKVQAALAVATQETTMALINWNFDFSLVKVEAPVEFHGLGSALSTKRRNASESGDHHRTARKLGSLFEQLLPDVPNLVKAYGLRASEIAKSTSGTSQGAKSYGPFSDYVGIDGTNIWAAATSGNAAIAIHLLACMLARIWKASEAISVWEQIIAARKQDLSTFDETGSIPIQSLVTSQLALTRDQLSEWDASARAWLRTADEAKALNQKQLTLIIENVNIPVSFQLPSINMTTAKLPKVNREMDVYSSVIHAWKTAMIAMDKLVVGMGHSVHEGCVLLGLAAWHLYPDMIVLGSSSTEVKQNDPLVNPGGIITIGLQGANLESRGVYWSLPLAYVRYYGDPLQSEGSISSDSSRVTMDQFLQVMLGALFTCWGLNGSKVREAAKLIIMSWRCYSKGLEDLSYAQGRPVGKQGHWLKIMADAANHLLKSKGAEQDSCRRLIALGQKRCHLLGRPSYALPVLGIYGYTYVSLIENPEAKILFLRGLAPKFCTTLDTLIIRIQVNTPENLKAYEYLTALPNVSSGLSDRSGNQWEFHRWNPSEIQDPIKSEWLRLNKEHVADIPGDDIENLPDVSWFRWHNPPVFFQDPPMVSEDVVLDDESEANFLGILSQWNPFSSNTSKASSIQKPVITFEPIFGDPPTGAIFRRTDRPDINISQNLVSLEELSMAFHTERINPRAFVEHLAGIQPTKKYDARMSETSSYQEDIALICLKNLETAVMVYKQLSGVTISLHVIAHEALASTHWAMASESAFVESSESNPRNKILGRLLPDTLSRETTFSCIAFFESGGFNIDPKSLQSVMAISSGNSIFVAAPLLCDPAIEPASHSVQRIIGNVGRSGIAFLFPPESPKIKEWDLGFYQVVRHEEFDGRLDDYFQSTTLHLSFSGYELPIDVGAHGGRFVEAFFLEAVVSVHDRGEWVADLDVLSTFDSSLFYSLKDQPACLARAPIPTPEFSVVTIDSWKELIDRPMQVAVLRAHGNWLARLAAASLSVRLGIPTVVFGESCCWSCGEKMWKQVQDRAAQDEGEGSYTPPSVVFIL